jgi:hypothetical protein
MDYFCKECSQQFEPYSKIWNAKYCSNECKNEVYKKSQKSMRDKRTERLKTDKQYLANDIYNKYKRSAIKRGYEFTLDINYFVQYINAECHYCGDIINKVGFDRIDNKKGYTIQNTVPCCTICNIMKHSHGYEDFINHAKKIANTHVLN